MRDHATNLVGALCALFVLVVLVVPTGNSPGISRPTTEDRGGSGLYVLKEWLDRSGVATHALRNGYASLDHSSRTRGSGHVLVLTYPLSRGFDQGEIDSLVAWLGQGNQLLLEAAVDDLPIRPGNEDLTLGKLLVQMGLCAPPSESRKTTPCRGVRRADVMEGTDRGIQAEVATVERLLRPRTYYPVLDHALMDGIDWLTLPPAPRRSQLLFDAPGALSLRLLHGEDTLLWYLASDTIPGGMLLFTDSRFLSNGGIGAPERARFIENYLDLYLGRTGRVIFDDFHQGLTDLYDARALFSDPRFWHSIIALVLLWLTYVVLYGSRLGGLAVARPGVPGDEFLRRVGNLLARHVPREAINRHLLRGFNNAARRRLHLSLNGETVIAQLASGNHLNGSDLDELRSVSRLVEAGRALSPVHLQRALARLQEKL